MSRHKKNKTGLHKKIPPVFKDVPIQQNDDVHQHGLISWFKRKKAKAMTKMEERLKAESQARAKAEERLRQKLRPRPQRNEK